MMGRRLRASSGKPINPDLPPISEGLVGYWPMDDGSGDFARDATGNGNDAHFAGTIVPVWTPYAGDNVCLGIDEEGWLEVAPSAILDDLPLITMTVKMISFDRYGAIMVNDCVGSCYPRIWMGMDNEKLEIYIFDGVTARGFPSPFDITQPDWIGCAGSMSAESSVVDFQLVAGSQSGSNPVIVSSVNAASAGWTFGGSRSINTAGHQARSFTGYIRDLRIYNRVLTIQECLDINSGVG